MRRYHSPSSIDLGRRCEYAWALCYIAKLREPDIDYREIEAGRIKAVRYPSGPRECSYKQRGASLGTGAHSTYEQHWTYGEPDWSWFPGVVAESGLEYWPARDECEAIEVEHEIGTVPIEQDDPRKPSRGMRIGQILIAGKRDVALLHGGKWLLGDYKCTSNILAYAKTAEVLIDDVAANAYAFDMYEKHPDAFAGDCRWLYHETKEKRRAVPIDFVISRAHALDILGEAATFAAHLDTIVKPVDAKQNTRSCCDFSGRPGEIGCYYHQSKGGPCTARPGLGMLIQMGSKRNTMPTAEELKAKLQASKGGKAATTETTDTATTETSETSTTAVPPKPKAGKGKAPTAPAGASAIVAKAAEVAEAQAVVDAAAAALVAKKQELAALCA